MTEQTHTIETNLFAAGRARDLAEFEKRFAADLAALEADLGYSIPRTHPKIDECFRRRIAPRGELPGDLDKFRAECRKLVLGSSIETGAQAAARAKAQQEAEAAAEKLARLDAAREASVRAWNETLDKWEGLRKTRDSVEYALAELRARVAKYDDAVATTIRGGGYPSGVPLRAVSLLADARADREAVPRFEQELATLDSEIAASLESLRDVTKKHDVPRNAWPTELLQVE